MEGLGLRATDAPGPCMPCTPLRRETTAPALRVDLEAIDVQHENGNKQERHRIEQEDGPSQEREKQAKVHGVAREAIDAGGDQR